MSIIAKQVVMFLAAGPLMISAAAFADEVVEEKGYLTISEVSVDYESSTMMIIGSDLNFGPDPLQVTLGGTDISRHCVLDDPLAEDPQIIFCDSLTLPVAADLLLIVSNGQGATQTDEYDLTFGTVGPQGIQGEKGEKGDSGPRGEQGEKGSQGRPGNNAFFNAANCDPGSIIRFTDNGLKCFSRRAVFASPRAFKSNPKTTGRGSSGLNAADKLCQGAADSDGSIVLVGKYATWFPTSAKNAEHRLRPFINDGYVLQDHTTLHTSTVVDLISGSVIHSSNQHEKDSTNTDGTLRKTIPQRRLDSNMGKPGNMAGTTSGITQQWTDVYIKTQSNKCASILYRTVTRS
jgi:hypothetical protein